MGNFNDCCASNDINKFEIGNIGGKPTSHRSIEFLQAGMGFDNGDTYRQQLGLQLQVDGYAGGSLLWSSQNPYTAELVKTAKGLVAAGKGILAADESTGTIGKRFDQIKVENTHQNRQAYRELLFTCPGLSEYVSGVIMFDETVRDSTVGGVKFTKVLQDKGIYCGIKVDTGLVPIAGTDDETITQGLDGLGKRCAEYYKLGCRFAKWRAVLKIGPNG